ncbi:hypothetical protein [Bacillus phage Tavor_SA]|uniref:Uncharacterized protein n=1 Tax=Bacillus phage Tavor_SA TaxID=1983581 RepID=A0A288WFU8_9CAUD|nr:hypothetical protein P9C75_gp45 [Bacillus phage Tavor_SA]ARW58437.1 hypothetical protein [Bacillus phage Tavor_SA]
MWMVHDYEEGVVLITDNYEEALKEYEKYVESAKDWVQENGCEFDGEERVILAKLERQAYGSATGRTISGSTYDEWDWKEEKY